MNLRWYIAQFFERLWWRHYLKRRDKAAYLSWKCDYWQNFLKISQIEIPKDAKILDAGCGPAGIFIIFNNYQTDALDPLLDTYERDLPHFAKADYPKINFFSESLEHFHTTEQYEVVFCLNAINHVADLEAAFDKLIELARVGGTIAVSVDAHRSPLLKKIFQWLPGDILHPHQFDLIEYRSMLERRGCTIENTVLIKREPIFDYHLLVAKKSPTS